MSFEKTETCTNAQDLFLMLQEMPEWMRYRLNLQLAVNNDLVEGDMMVEAVDTIEEGAVVSFLRFSSVDSE